MDDWTHRLYRDFAPDLYRIARYRLGDEALAQDMVQEVFLRLLERENKLRHHRTPRAGLSKPWTTVSSTRWTSVCGRRP